MDKNIIELKNISKSFAEHLVIDDVSFSIKKNEFITLLGPSGCGKTTLLRILSGLEQPDVGDVLLNGKSILGLPADERKIHMVFQSYALFPHMTVFDNVAFGLKCQKVQKDEIKYRVEEVLKIVHLEGFYHRKPSSLSGGQQQRVAVARAVVNRPLVLLLDEPLSALDYHLRKKMQMELKSLQRRLGIAFVLVTHDQEEALTMSDRVVVMKSGDVQQIGAPRDIYEEPSSLFVAAFIGEANIFYTNVSACVDNTIKVYIENRSFTFKNKKQFVENQSVAVIFRPEDIDVYDTSEVDDSSGMLPGFVEEVIYKGSTVDLKVRLESGKIISATEFFNEDDDNLDYHLGEKVWVSWMNGWEVILPHER